MSAVFDLACALIERASVTPDDAGCQDLLGARLARCGFSCERLRYGQVDNLWATHGQGGPVLVLLGHTDVVPSGPPQDWTDPPFTPTVRAGRLYGRGAADMKGSVAAMCVALEDFVARHPDHAGTVALLVTSDEEGIALDGVRRVARTFVERRQRIDWCIVGEPSSRRRLGDLIRVGRRGSLTGRLRVAGVQGHVAYPEQASNPIHAFAAALAELTSIRWDEGDAAFPPTSFQVSNIAAGTGADNVIPGELRATFNFRYGIASSADGLIERVESLLRRHGLDFELAWHRSGEPFVTAEGALREAVTTAIRMRCGVEAEASTGGGTSDGRFIAPLGAEVVELGPCNESIHKVDESIALDELEALPGLYEDIIERMLRLRR
ncbi:MAG TPA: succinyl-diaminopimelate desuccinylase [Dokdonella sp.]|uniref:succinyl-diaminopimelate desuccinylase n=1 Tax=Dokdonella sp. TaxID=2291710 RepID=UPI002B8A96EC|nr:succinyl-diaminopimelate desuccinylase [Dokdonella sp.]HUD41756.1 succinyl-diaminopimelate desuccinylase [Dokdonella sp.]